MTTDPTTVTGMNPTRLRAIEQLRRIVLDELGERDAAVYLFGSMATGDVRPASDIDVAIFPRTELPRAFFAELTEKIEESTIPYDVDVVDLREVSPDFREAVQRTAIKWRD
jgi:predicted nucleotidyltransferase